MTYEAKLHSESVNKWTREIEDRFSINANGSTPTERMNNVLENLDKIIKKGGSSEEIRSFVQELISRWYKVGAKRGAAQMLKGLMFYGIIPNDINSLKELLELPIELGDSLSWNATLRYIEHPSDGNKPEEMSVCPEIFYSEIIEKLESIYKKPLARRVVRKRPLMRRIVRKVKPA